MTSPNTIIADLTAEVETIRKQRDELLSAMENIISFEHDWCTHPEDLRDIARLAIANAKGGS